MIAAWESSKPGIFLDAFRSFLTVFDMIAVTLLGAVYKIFFLVANATIISGDVIKVFYSRIQLILGILMIFKLAMSILNIIINPDIIKDQKQGPSKIVIRVVVALFMLTLVIPINIPNAAEHSLNSYINDHGILFGFLYKAQDSILSENILAKLILGTSSDSTSDGMDVNSLSDIGKAMSSTVLKVFVRINVKDDTLPPCEDSNTCDNTICPAEVNDSHYAEENIDSEIILSHINDDCKNDDVGKRYAFAYTPLVGALIMIIMAIIIVGFTVDVAVRAIKLALLRLVAPVPIISYINPPKQGGGAFDNWTKSLISTYVDLFVRLAIVYFGLFMIQIIMNGGMDIFGSNVQGFTFTSGVAFIFIILGILVFMRQAPQFIKDVLGIKGKPMGNVGLSSLLGGTAMAIGGGGLAGFGLGAMQGFDTANRAAAEGKAFSPFQSWSQNSDMMAKIRTGDKDARGGIFGRTIGGLNFLTAERRANQLGIGRNARAAKKYDKDQKETKARATAEELRLATSQIEHLGVSSDPGQAMSRDEFWNSSAYQSGSYSGLEESFENTYQRYLNDHNTNKTAWDRYTAASEADGNAQAAAAKAAKTLDRMEKDAGLIGATQRVVDSRGRGTYRSARKVRINPQTGNPVGIDGHDTDVESNFTYERDTKYDGIRDDETPPRFPMGGGPRP